MNRRIILIIGAALLFALVVGLTWFFFFRSAGEQALPGGSFGSGEQRPGTTGSGGTGGNTGSNTIPGQGGTTGSVNIPIGGSGGTGGNGQGSGGAGGITGGGTLNGAGGVTGGGADGLDAVGGIDGLSGVDGNGTQIIDDGGITAGDPDVPGVDWLGGPGGGPTTSFVPSTINQINDGLVGGSPSIQPTIPTAEQGGGASLVGLGGLFGAGAGCALLFATSEGTANADAAARGGASFASGFVLTYDFNAYKQRSQTQFKDVSDCLTRTIAKAVLQQITSSIVNWINSGFNGKPSFITNYQQFFSNVGDQAAGEFLRGTGLSFLCSPFQLQIKVAIAQSYARRNAPACTLTGVIKNITSFMNGSFSQGGWKGLLQFTTVPTNNPYGAYAYAQAGLQTAQSQALANARNNISPGGFMSVQKCDPPGSKNCKTVTPGAVIEQSLATTLGTSQRTLEQAGISGSFDAIISALITQLTVKTLYNGLSTMSGQSGYASSYLTPEQQQAQVAAQNLLTEFQGRVQVAQQFGSVQQGSIRDMQNVQNRLEGLANCWEVASSTPGRTAAQVATAQQNALAAANTISAFEELVAARNQQITRANEGIAILQDLQTRAVSAATPADVAAVQAAYDSAVATGALISVDDVTNAQQDRASLQAQLTTRNQEITNGLQQCNAF